MDFGLNDDQKMLVDMVSNLAEKEFRPKAKIWDEEERFPYENIEKLAELGLLGMSVPEKYGGSDQGVFDVVLVLENIAKACFTTAAILAMQLGGGSRSIVHFGSDEIKEKFLPDLVRGKTLAAYAQTEPDAGSDVGNVRTKAVLDGDYYIINGTKCFISNAIEAGFFVTIVRFNDQKGTRGLGSILIEQGTEGLIVGKNEHKLGMKGTSICTLTFEDCRVPKNNILVKAGEFRKMMEAFNAERCGNAAFSLGVGQGAFDEAVRYSKERVQFGKTLSKFQGIQWMIAEMHIKLEAARLLVYRAAANVEKGLPKRLESSVAKAYANEVAFDVCNTAMQIFGGYGYMREYPLERMLREARFPLLGGGSVQIQKNNIAHLLLRD